MWIKRVSLFVFFVFPAFFFFFFFPFPQHEKKKKKEKSAQIVCFASVAMLMSRVLAWF